MPAFSTHYIFANEIMDFITKNADFEVNSDAVYFGAQGPDIFFFHRVMPWMVGKSLRGYGSALHRCKPEILFESMRKYCDSSQNSDIAKSYTYGFLLHYALDRRCHPYVYYLQNRITDKSKLTNPHTAHNSIEFAMDSYLLNKRLGIAEPALFDTSQTVSSNIKVIDEISKLLVSIIPDVIGKSITKKQCTEALQDTKYIQKLCLDKGYAKHIITYTAETILAPFSRNFRFSSMLRPRDLAKAEKYANINNGIWKSPYDAKARKESFEELFELAKADAKRILTDYQLRKSCREITENISFLTGVEVE